MVSPDQLLDLPFFRGLDPEAIDSIAAVAEVRELPAGEVLAHQHDRAIALYFLLEGSIQHLVHVSGIDDLLVDATNEPGVMIGWSVFRAPFRHTATARCGSACRVLRIPRDAFYTLFEGRPDRKRQILSRATEALARRLELARGVLVAMHDSDIATPSLPGSLPAPPRIEGVGEDDAATVEFLQHATFFEDFTAEELAAFAEIAEPQTLGPGILFSQGDRATRFYLLIDGRIELRFAGSEAADSGFLRSLSGAGQAFGWSALVAPRRYRVTAVAPEPARVLGFDADALVNLADARPELGGRVLERMLWLIGNRLRSTRTQLIARRYDKEVLAVRALLEQSAESLHVTSPLHKIPYLLENRLTVSDAFDSLELVRSHGDELERNLADQSLEILDSIRQELQFYRGLQRIYEGVAHAPAELSPEEVRGRCMQDFRELFGQTCHRIRGEGHLPEQPGHVFIMNHLENHKSNLLPNDFRLTLDTHFVSSMIIHPRYGRAPIRVVRKPLPDWYGFQEYFDHLDYIYVYGGDIDEEDRDHHLTREDRTQLFLDRAHASLRRGDNLVICPEGQCFNTEDSPGPFRVGAFRVAATADPEVLIVPVAVAYFDRQLTRACTAAIVYPPFRISEHVDDPSDKAQLLAFIQQVNEDYRGYVREARHLAQDAN